MGLRQHKRRPLRSQVRLFGADAQGKRFSRLAETVDVSRSGARVSGVFLDLRIGSEVDVEAEGKHGHFRIVWQGQVGTERAGEVALQSIDASVVLWPDEGEDWTDTFDPEAAQAQERRFYRRFDCSLAAQMTVEGESVPRLVNCADLSFGGCYLEHPRPLPEGAKLSISIAGPSGPPLQADGFVRSCHPPFGMGVRFTCVEDPKVLAALLDSLRKGNSVPGRRWARVMLPTVSEEESMLAGKTVLLVDDSLSVRNMIAQSLRRHGYSVVMAKDGEEGLAMVKSCAPDLILLDILLPKLSGLGVLRKLKLDPATRDIPVIVISSLSEDNDARVIAEGACGYVAKSQTPPDQFPHVVDRTFQHLRSAASHQAATMGNESLKAQAATP
jgi:twitching motility two-component system response regulator PilH